MNKFYLNVHKDTDNIKDTVSSLCDIIQNLSNVTLDKLNAGYHIHVEITPNNYNDKK